MLKPSFKKEVLNPLSHGRGGGAVRPPPSQPILKMVSNDSSIAYIFSVLRVLKKGLKKASTFDFFQKCQNQNLYFLIFSRNSFRNELKSPFLTYFDAQHSICEIFTCLPKI